MKQLNFKELNVEIEVDSYGVQDARKGIGNALHKASESVPMSDLARAIFYSEGPIAISDEDYVTMLALLKDLLKKFIYDALIRSTENIVEEKERSDV